MSFGMHRYFQPTGMAGFHLETAPKKVLNFGTGGNDVKTASSYGVNDESLTAG